MKILKPAGSGSLKRKIGQVICKNQQQYLVHSLISLSNHFIYSDHRKAQSKKDLHESNGYL